MIKFITDIILNFGKILQPYKAQIIDNKFTAPDFENLIGLKRDVKKKKKLKYYIIRRSPGAGLFSNFIYVLNHLKIADSCGYIPIVDMENHITIYNEKVKVLDTKNSWNYFFGNKIKVDLRKIYKENSYILTSNKFSKYFSHEINNDKFRSLFNRYFFLKKNYTKFVNEFVRENFKNEKVIAVHLRGTSYKTSANHPLPVTIKQSLHLINDFIERYNYSKIFLCTEDLAYFNSVKKRFGKKVLYLDQTYRSFKDDAFSVYPRSFHRYKLGKEILVESLLISKCNSFLYSNSNVSEFVKFLDEKKKINYYMIDNGLNSSNEYIAKWYWYYKNIAPSVLGGFKSRTNVKKL